MPASSSQAPPAGCLEGSETSGGDSRHDSPPESTSSTETTVTDTSTSASQHKNKSGKESKSKDTVIAVAEVYEAKQTNYFKPGTKLGIRKFYDPTDPNSAKKITSSMIYLQFYNFFMSMSFGMTQIMSRNRLASSAHPTLYWAISMSLWCFVQILFNLPIGRLSDVMGRVRPLAVCAVVHGGCLIGFAFSYREWEIILTRLLCGITDSTLITLLAYTSDVTPSAKKASAISLVTMINQMSSLLIMMIISFTFSSVGVVNGKYFPIGLGCICILFGLFLPLFVVEPASRFTIIGLKAQYAELRAKKRKGKEKLTKEEAEMLKKLKDDISTARKEYLNKVKKRGRWIKIIGKLKFRFKSIDLMSGVASLTTFAMFSVFAIMIDFVVGHYSVQVQQTFSYQMLGGIVAMILSILVLTPPILLRLGPNRSVSIGVCLQIIGIVVFGFVPEGQVAASIVAFVLLCLGFGMVNCSLNTIFSFWGDPDERGLISAVVIFCRDVGRCLAPIISVGFFQIHYSISFIIAIIGNLISVVLIQYYVEPPATKDRLVAMSIAMKEKRAARRRKLCRCCAKCYRSHSMSGHFRVMDASPEKSEVSDMNRRKNK